MSKVLMVGNDHSVKGGISSVINQLLQYKWRDNDVEMIFIPTYKGSNIYSNILFFSRAYFRVIRQMLLNRPDYIHIHMSYKGSFYRASFIQKLCKIFHTKCLVHLHGSEFQVWYQSLSKYKKRKVRKFLKDCFVLVVLGNEWEKKIKDIEPLTKIKVINNTIEIPEKKSNWACEHDSVFKIVFMGVLIKRKGLSDLLKAMSILKEQQVKCKLIIAGSGSEEQELKRTCSDLNLNDYVDFIGWIKEDQKEKIYLNSQLSVLPSYNEGLPVSILESIGYGLPVIATDVGDISEAVIDCENGWLIKVGDPEGLALKIKKAVQLNENEWTIMSNNSRKIANEKFSDENYMSDFLNIYLS